MSVRVEFKLSMPGRASWNGRWSGEEKNYTIVKSLSIAAYEKLFGGPQVDQKSWSYSWPDGWAARVDARVVHPGVRLKKSDGFNGYDWMVASILQYGKIYADHQRPDRAASP